MRPVSSDEMTALDSNCRYFGLLPLQLMENAGSALAREVAARARGKRIAVIAGRGNNGGDAFVAARHMAGFAVTVFLLGRSRDIATKEARRNWDILERLGYDLREIKDASQLCLGQFDLILDGIFGTGVRGPVLGLEALVIDAINSSGRPVISVDIPSGLGTNKVVKADSGRILVIGGGPYTGAPALSAMAALRAGADIVTVAAPKSAARTISGYSPNLIVQELSGDHLCPADLPVLKEQIARHDVVVMGMGLGRHAETGEALAEILPLCKKTVLDADALLPDLPLKGIVTPHAGEFLRISGISLVDLNYKERVEPLKGYAREKGLVVLLKGKVDLISDGEVVRANTTGNPGMTVGGTGDVLAGIVAAFYARAPALRAATAAAYVNGRAGDLVYPEKDFGMVATDVIEKIPEAMRL
jgi:hydroxyethylthiazole kinase-like uncharacterized protein yjeF